MPFGYLQGPLSELTAPNRRMLVSRLFNAIAASVTAAFLVMPAWAQQPPPAKNWKDRGEYDLYVSITKEADPSKQLALLDSWKQKYPQTDYAPERYQFYISVYQKLNQAPKIIETAKEMIAADPKAFQGLYWISFLTPGMNDNSPAALEAGEKAGNGLIAVLDDFFSADKKPENMTPEQWKSARETTESVAHKVLGWVDMQNKQGEEAAKHLRRSLELNPKQGEVSYWVGTSLLMAKKPEVYPEALYHFARAASYDGEGALNPQGRKQVGDYFTKVYTTYHGSRDGLDELLVQAKAAPFPPEGFAVKSAAVIAFEKQEALKQSNPQLALWLGIKGGLAGDGSDEYFAKMKGFELPKLKGKVVSQTPEKKPTQVVVSLEDGVTPEVTLKFDAALANPAPHGSVIEFTGVASTFTREPFMLTLDMTKDKLEGWPAPAPPPKKKAKAKK